MVKTKFKCKICGAWLSEANLDAHVQKHIANSATDITPESIFGVR